MAKAGKSSVQMHVKDVPIGKKAVEEN